MANKVALFFNDVKLEMGKVSWPNKDELIGSTVIVLVSLAILAIVLLGSFTPETFYDTLNYHIGVPLQWMNNHRIFPRA